MDGNDFPLTSSLDQPLVVDTSSLSREIDSLVDRAIETGDIDIITSAIANLRKAAFLSEFGLVRILRKLKDHWEEFNYGGTWEDLVYIEIGLSKTTVTRYLYIYEMYESVPDELLSEIQGRPLKDQVAIATYAATTEEISEDQWKALADAPTSGDLGQVIADLRGVERRSNHVRITVDRDGSLWAYPGKKSVGYLNMLDCDDLTVKKAIRRIISAAGIQEV